MWGYSSAHTSQKQRCVMGLCSGQCTLNHTSKGNESSEVLNFLCRWKSAKILCCLETAFSFFTNEFLNNNTEGHVKAFLLIFHPVNSKSRNQTPDSKKQWKWLPVPVYWATRRTGPLGYINNFSIASSPHAQAAAPGWRPVPANIPPHTGAWVSHLLAITEIVTPESGENR